VRFFRISNAAFSTPAAAFSGIGASKTDHRWSWGRSTTRAVYCSDTLSLACLECLVHVRPLPRISTPSVYYSIEVPDALLESPARTRLPQGWDAAVATAGSRDFGSRFLEEKRAVGLVVPTAILPEGLNVLLNPNHSDFKLSWVEGPKTFRFDTRLE
jgi:RES domain-containing protein